MKANPTLLILALFAGIIAKAQKNLQPGYIVNNANDTSNGFIDFREWYKNPETVLFSPSKETALQKFTINDASGFSITGREQYKRYYVAISMNKNVVGDMNERDTTQRKDSVWLKVLLAGRNVQLFSYADDVKSRLYILPSDETVPVELKNTEYLSGGQLVSEKEYKHILLANAKKYAPGNIELINKISSTGFYKTDILDICYKINGLDKNAIKNNAVTAIEKQHRFKFWAGIGVNNGKIKIDGNNRYSGITNGSTISPLFAAGFNILVNPLVGRMFFSTDVSYATYKAGAYTATQYFAAKENYYFKFKQSNITLNEILNYNIYNGKNFKYFIGAGAGLNFSSYPLNQQTFIREAHTDTTTIVNDNYVEHIKNFWLNAIVRTGISVKNVEVAISYLPNSTLSNYGSYEMHNSSLRLQVNYVFKK